MAKCAYCGQEFDAKRSTAKYCSSKCRVNANRGLSVTDSVTPELSVTDEQPINVTLKDSKLDANIPEFETDLPDCVPFPIAQRYTIPSEHEYRATIDRLLSHTLDELKTNDIWIPLWRYGVGEDKVKVA